MPIDDKKLLAEVLGAEAGAGIDPRELRVLDVFEDAKGEVWIKGQPMPQLGGKPWPYRVLALFYAGTDENDIKAYCVPSVDPYPAMGFRIFRLHRFSGSMGVENMTLDIFKETLVDELMALEERMLASAESKLTAEDLARRLHERGVLGKPDLDDLIGREDDGPNGAAKQPQEGARA
jgi:hypothetical protein